MANVDSIINVDEWISDYYLTTDETKGESFTNRAADAVKAWKAEDKQLAKPVSPWSRLTSTRNQLQTTLSLIDAPNAASVDAAAEAIERAFGYPAPGELELTRAEDTLGLNAGSDRAGTVIYLRTTPISGVEELTDATLRVTPTRGGKPLPITAVKAVTEVFLSDDAPAFVVLIAGAWVVLAERETWPLGRYLAVDVALAAERNDTTARGELTLVAAALAREHIERAADGTTWWTTTLEQSRNHAVKVSEDLRHAIKESIEIIGNDVLRRHEQQDVGIDAIAGDELAKQALRYLYRILFLLFAEASPELNILPTGVPEYDEGYGLANLREKILTEPPTDRAASGTYLYDSLQLLFELINTGHDPLDEHSLAFDDTAEPGLTFRSLSADLFLPEATSYISAVKLSNAALHRVLQNLLLTREVSGKDRGFVSYASLGVTQLGQVYEGLMSYTGSIAATEMFEVAPKGDASKGSWLVTPALAADLPQDSFVQEVTGEGVRRNRRYAPGDFVFRQSSRDRERSASFYSPPVITEFVVGQAIEELDAAHRIDAADDILRLKICEPAMGSGAFAVEAVNQLAELYLEKKQQELGETIDPERLTEELQKVKASIALHQVYGVDLNKTAVELAEISLWLNTMSSQLHAPWFGLHLRHGNSLIGASRSTVTAASLRKRDYLTQQPVHHPVTTVAAAVEEGTVDAAVLGRVHHFLVPSKGWGSPAESKDLKEIAPKAIGHMKAWRKEIRKGFSAADVTTLKDLATRVERLWQLALVRLRIAEDQASRRLDIFGHATPARMWSPASKSTRSCSATSTAPTSAYAWSWTRGTPCGSGRSPR
ncbi:hypothetical protein CUTER_10235 [Corynebacterium uterequi]|uniref:site-specific DNA-methyltransferase (adenine-specific) n=1 Tax=Corynebacterium uterequi TaxID=1072256 RepID=A0A0G3HFC0_9CORY|nr:DNA methyltransferase [Corynebacterium uterequi]AKK12014.1 hypothetical protein CUTER_10235 [Corynebacterium uterequi]